MAASASSGTVKGVSTSVPEWSIREQLVLASAVQRSGDQNWVSVSRAIRPVMEEPKQQQDFSQKNCATQYAFMLDNASTPKRKRREDGGPEIVETVEEQIVRHLTEKRIKEIDQTLSQIKEEYMTTKKEIELIERGELDDRLHTMWQEMQPETTSSETPTKEPSAVQRSSPSNLTKFQIPSRQETELPSNAEPPSSFQQQKEPKVVVKQEPPQSPPKTIQQTSTTVSVAPSNPVATSSASDSSSPSSQHSSSKEVHQEHSYSKQEITKKDNTETEKPSEAETPSTESTETTTADQKQEGEESDLTADKNETPKPTADDKAEEKINTDVKEDTQLPKVIEEASSLQSSNGIEDSQDKPPASTTEETPPQAADKEEEDTTTITTVEEDHQIVQEESVKMEQAEEDVEVDVDVETRDDELEQQQQGTDSVEKEAIDQKTVDEEKVTDKEEKDEDEEEKDKKAEVKKPEGEEEEEEINVEEDDEEASPVRVRATRSSDGRKRRQPDISRMLLKEEEREGSPSSLPSPRVRRTTRASAKKRRTTRSARLRAEEKDDSLIDSREVTDQESEEELTSAFSSSVPSPAYSQGDGTQEAHHAQRSWRKTIMLVWHHASQHKFATLFLHPVREEDAPGYYEIIHKPMDLSTIKRNIETGTIKTDMEFQHAMLLMFQNALMYNSSDHDVYRMAEEMKNDVVTQIDEYLKTQKMVSNSGTKALRSREARLRPDGASTEESLFHKKMNTEEPTPGKKRKPRAED